MDTRAPNRIGTLACVLLAAGGSRRLGAPKQLVRHRGRPLIVHAVEAATAVIEARRVIVVLGAEALRLRAVLRRLRAGTRQVVNARWREGLAASLRAGLRAAPPGTRAVLVMVVDQPQVDREALQRLVAAWRRRPALPAAARYGGKAGVPAILPRRTWREIDSLHGDVGARGVLRNVKEMTLVNMPEAAFDVDTPEDLARL